MPFQGRCSSCGWFSHIWGSYQDTEMELWAHTLDSHGEDAVLRCEIKMIGGEQATAVAGLMTVPAFWRGIRSPK
jgi:hypothetical protein